MQKIMLLLFLLVFSSGGFAKVEKCGATPWPFSSDMKNLKLSQFKAVPRPHLYRYLYSELSTEPAKRIKGLAQKLFYYLKNTEVNENRYYLVSALEWASDLNTPNPRVISVAEICSLEEKIERAPSSATPSHR